MLDLTMNVEMPSRRARPGLYMYKGTRVVAVLSAVVCRACVKWLACGVGVGAGVVVVVVLGVVVVDGVVLVVVSCGGA